MTKMKKKHVSKSEISRVMSEMGSKGGKIGGKRRLITMTQDERRESAYLAAQARWLSRKEFVNRFSELVSEHLATMPIEEQRSRLNSAERRLSRRSNDSRKNKAD